MVVHRKNIKRIAENKYCEKMLCEHESAPEDRMQNKSKRIVDSGDEEAQGRKITRSCFLFIFYFSRNFFFFLFHFAKK